MYEADSLCSVLVPSGRGGGAATKYLSTLHGTCTVHGHHLIRDVHANRITDGHDDDGTSLCLLCVPDSRVPSRNTIAKPESMIKTRSLPFAIGIGTLCASRTTAGTLQLSSLGDNNLLEAAMTTRKLLPTAHCYRNSTFRHTSPHHRAGPIVYLYQGRDWTVMACHGLGRREGRGRRGGRGTLSSRGRSNPRRPMCHLITGPP